MAIHNLRELSLSPNCYARSQGECPTQETPAALDYQGTMRCMGKQLGATLDTLLPDNAKCVLVAGAEDADYLGKGVLDALSLKYSTKTAVFWNNYYHLSNGTSVAPVVHKFLEPGYENANALIVVKSVLSGCCMVRTHILEMIERIKAKHIYIVSPLMYTESEQALVHSFPGSISNKFTFVNLVCDPDERRDITCTFGSEPHRYKRSFFHYPPMQAGHIPELVKQLTA